ncbi:MAG: Slp family lipoprotein [Gammaproteobacteria bacterium]|nr:Slp family lipoprotein [Gammaproteobacteria bacterium]
MKILSPTCLLAILLLGGCATTPAPEDTGLTPDDVVAGNLAAQDVHWGGRIVRVENLRDHTRVEVLSFPLSDTGEPLVNGRAQGRFIVEKPGFLEPREYAPERRIEVHGRVRSIEDGQVGDAAYRYPLVAGDRVKLWPDADAAGTAPRQPRVNFGFGFGTYGSGAGIGIGF